MRHSASLLVLLPLAVGCAPYDAEVKGSWHLYLAANSSNTVDNDEIENLDDMATRYECVRTFDEEEGRYADGYIGPDISTNEWESSQFVGNPCQSVVADDGGTPDDSSDDVYELLPGLIADADEGEEPTYLEQTCTQEMMARYYEQCTPIQDTPSSSSFLADDGYYAMKGSIEPWRTEAILTGEGELQLTIHQRIQGEDWYYLWVIDPDFNPVRCKSSETGDGSATVEPIGGSNWLEQWSIDEDGHDIYYINSGAFHTADQGDTLWYYPREWQSGSGYGNFLGEEFLSVQPDVVKAISQYGSDQNLDDADGDGITDEYEQTIDQVSYRAAVDRQGWVENAAAYDGDWAFDIKVEDNTWRPIDGVPTGLDGWVETHSGWVRIDSGSDIREGGTVKGDFQMVLSGLESASRLVIQGEFTVEELRVDKWAYDVIADDLRADPEWSGTEYCE